MKRLTCFLMLSLFSGFVFGEDDFSDGCKNKCAAIDICRKRFMAVELEEKCGIRSGETHDMCIKRCDDQEKDIANAKRTKLHYCKQACREDLGGVFASRNYAVPCEEGCESEYGNDQH